MIKKLIKLIASRRALKGVLTGVGGGVLTAVGWKLGTDIYDHIKRRVHNSKEPIDEAAAAQPDPRSGQAGE